MTVVALFQFYRLNVGCNHQIVIVRVTMLLFAFYCPFYHSFSTHTFSLWVRWIQSISRHYFHLLLSLILFCSQIYIIHIIDRIITRVKPSDITLHLFINVIPCDAIYKVINVCIHNFIFCDTAIIYIFISLINGEVSNR